MTWIPEEKAIEKIQIYYKSMNKLLTFDTLDDELNKLETRLFEEEIPDGEYVFGMDNEPIFKRQYYWPSEEYMVAKNPGIFDRIRIYSDQSQPHSY